jgi:hypothetical protein
MLRRGGKGLYQDLGSAIKAQRKQQSVLPPARTAWSGAGKCCSLSQCSPVSAWTRFSEVGCDARCQGVNIPLLTCGSRSA